jgi:hypothetical protein
MIHIFPAGITVGIRCENFTSFMTVSGHPRPGKSRRQHLNDGGYDHRPHLLNFVSPASHENRKSEEPPG